ncbi:hypothetical protein GCM10009582_18930 [Arthrobacter flavus]
MGAESRAANLAAAATALSVTVSSGGAPSAGAPSAGAESDSTESELSGAYAETADILQEQAEALWHPILSNPIVASAPPTAGSSEPTGTAESPAAPEPTPTPAGFVTDLFSSAQQNLDAAVTAEPGIARLLASIGTSQRRQALALADLQGLKAPAPGPLPTVTAGPSPTCAAATPRDGASGDSTPRADTRPVDYPEADLLGEAVAAEHRSAYAYEVAAARGSDPSTLVEFAGQHASAAAAGEILLQTITCPQPDPQAPAFALDAAFFDDPEATLAALNSELITMYADLVGLTEGPARLWAVQRFSDLADHQHLATDAAEAFPGIRD